MAKGRLLVLVNRNASRAEQSMGDAFAGLAAGGFDLDIRQPDDSEQQSELIRRHGGSADAIVIAGGDGTVSGAVAALIAAERPVGILPLGTANDLALTLGIPGDPQAAAAVIAAGRLRKIDVGRVNDVHFLNVASIGLSTAIAERQTAELKQQWGFLSYAIATIATLTEAEHFQADVICNGETRSVDAFQIAVGNGVHYGSGLTIAEDAAIDDGMLDICAIETRSVADLVTVAQGLRDGSLGRRDDVRAFRCRKARIETAEPLPVNTDGEITTNTPADFSVLRAALSVFVPAEA
jgi:YegS/Rv2252/BmrU family lipid kinase